MKATGSVTRTGQTVVSGAAVGFGGSLAIYATGFVTSVLIARAVGAEGRGEYYLAVIAATIAVVVVNVGLENANTVSLAERRFSLPELSRNASTMALALGAAAIGGMVVLYLVAGATIFRDLSLGNYLIAVVAIPLALHGQWLANFLLLAKQLARSQIAKVTAAAVQLGGAVALYAFGVLEVTEVLILYSVTVAVMWLLQIRWWRRLSPVRPSLNPELVREVVGFGIKIHAANVVLFLLLRGDTFLVSGFLGTADVGIYSLAVLFGELALLMTTPITEAAVPFQVEASAPASAGLAFKAARFNFALAAVLTAGFAASLWLVIPVLYGEQFSPAYPAVMALLPGVMLLAASRPLTLLLLRTRRPIEYGGVALAALALNVALNVLLLPTVGIIGASIASSIAYAALAITWVTWALRAAPDPAASLLLPQRDDWHTFKRLWARVRGGLSRIRS